MNERSSKLNVIFWFFLSVVLIFTLRASILNVPIIDIDEAIFGVFASAMDHGLIPYVDITDNKPPLIFLFFLAIWKIFGEKNMLAVHIITTVWILITAWTVGLIAKHMAGFRTCVLASFFYLVLTTLHEPKYLATNINILIALPISLSFFFFILGTEKNRSWLWIASGMMAAIAIFLRYQGGIIAIVIGVCSLIETFSLRSFIKRGLLFLTGVLFITACVLAYLYQQGVVDAYLLSFKTGVYYSEQAKAFAFWPRFFNKSSLFIFATLPIFALVVHFGIKLLRPSSFSKKGLYLMIWFLLSWIPVCMGRRFYGHYYIMLLPPMAVMAALSFTSITSRLTKGVLVSALVIWTSFFFIIRFESLGIRQKVGIHPTDWIEVENYQYPIGDYLKEHTASSDRIFIWGLAPSVYFYSDRFPATRFLCTDMLVNRITGGSKFRTGPSQFKGMNEFSESLWKILFEEFEEHIPVYIVDTSSSPFGAYNKHLLKDFPLYEWMQKKGYGLETSIDGTKIYRKLK